MDPAPQYDPSRFLTGAALFYVGVLIVFVAVIIGVQIWQKGEANTESWAAMTGLIGWATSQVSIIFSNRYGTTAQSAAKDDTIKVQARTAEVAQSALLDPALTVTVDPAKRSPTAAPIQAETINVEATTANVVEKEPL